MSAMYHTRHDINRFIEGGGPFGLVAVGAVRGSAPREAGTWMLVTPDRTFRTIGGGQLEKLAIDRIRDMLGTGQQAESLKVPLGPEIGQCCGGWVDVSLQLASSEDLDRLVATVEAEQAALPHVYVFGAGHVGNALCEALALLPVRALLVDTRPDELAAAPAGVDTLLAAVPEAVVRDAPPASAFVILTHEHSLDFLIAREVLNRGDIAYAGMIGSKTKRATFERWLKRDGSTETCAQRLICPIAAGTVTDKRPEVIAALAAAELAEHLFVDPGHTGNRTSAGARNVEKEGQG
jgi:xanthine dehydrogenase accessory factor